MARKSRPRGGAASARPTAPKAAGTASAAGTAGAARTGAPQAGTAQLTAPAATAPDPKAPAASVDPKHPAYPGQQFGLPERGRGSVADIGRRLLALLIDWLLCTVIAYWLTRSQFWTIAVFAVEDFLFTALTGVTVGKRLVGIRVIRTNGGLVGLRWALVRTAILLTVIPPLLTDRDLRGLHDRAAGTIVVRL